MKKIIVIKFGGHAMTEAHLRKSFMESLKSAFQLDYNFVIIHGGGPHINNMLDKLEIKSTFNNGLRVTEEPTMAVVEMVLCGMVNKEIVRDLANAGLPPVGISGQDGNLFRTEILNPELGLVGKIVQVNTSVVSCLLERGFLPVIAPVALGIEGKPLNINADTAGGELAGALNADCFILISDVPGVLDDNGQLFSFLSRDAIGDLKASGIIREGMIPKVEACLNACRLGFKKAIILDGRKENCLENYLLKKELSGTEIGM